MAASAAQHDVEGKMVGVTGFEPATPASRILRANAVAKRIINLGALEVSKYATS
jgi:hypothetical protein